MNLSRFALAVAAVAAFSAPLAAGAQTTAPPPPAAAPAPPSGAAHRGHHAGPWMQSLHSLQLGDDQRRQIAALIKASHQANRGADRDTRRANAKQLHAQIEALLSPGQRVQFHAELRRERAARRVAHP